MVSLESEEFVLGQFAQRGLRSYSVGHTLVADIIILRDTITDAALFDEQQSMSYLRQIWESTSFELEKLQADVSCVTEEFKSLRIRQGPLFNVDFSIPDLEVKLQERRDEIFNVAIIREEGSNGEREMAWAVEAAGFRPWDVTMSDLESGKINLQRFRGVVFVGGFSFGDTLGSAAGWAAKISNDAGGLKEQFDSFVARKDTFSLGICNGCQLMVHLGWVNRAPSAAAGAAAASSSGAANTTINKIRLERNRSGRFESRFVAVKAEKDVSATWLRDMGTSTLGVWLSHGEGKFEIEGDANVTFRYVDDHDPTAVVHVVKSRPFLDMKKRFLLEFFFY